MYYKIFCYTMLGLGNIWQQIFNDQPCVVMLNGKEIVIRISLGLILIAGMAVVEVVIRILWQPMVSFIESIVCLYHLVVSMVQCSILDLEDVNELCVCVFS